MIRNTFLSILFAAISVFAYSQKLDVTEFKLDNGLTVILNENHLTPNVFGTVIVKAGGKNDPKDATGMAHYQEHMLFKGTEKLGTTNWEEEKKYIDKIFELYDELGKIDDEVKRKEIQQKINEASVEAAKFAIPNETSNIIKSMGGTKLNAGTGTDMTIFYNEFPPSEINKWIDLYAHRFENPVFRSFQAELEVVYEEKNMYQDMFIFPILEKFNKHFYKNHPYGQQTLIGTAEDLKNPSLSKMYKFFKTYYVPNNMALIISGDFDAKAVKKEIEKKFGQWKKGELPKPIKYEEKPFNGREFHEYKLSPIKLGILGFRTVPLGHEDELALNVCYKLLANNKQTGLLDKLALDNKIMQSMAFPMHQIDHGAAMFLFIPKILGQKLEEAEALVLNSLDSLKAGKFDDELLEAVKKEMIIDNQKAFESNEQIALQLSQLFVEGKSFKELLDYQRKVEKINKDVVIKMAQKYFGKDFLAFYSKMGFPEKDKVDKPGYEPLVSNTNAKSEYKKHIEQIKSIPYEPNYVDFEKDVFHRAYRNRAEIYVTQNPVNNIFDLTIKHGKGTYNNPKVEYAAQIMNYASPKGESLNTFKLKMASLGIDYSFYADESYTYINMSGLEENLPQAIKLIGALIDKPEVSSDKLDKIVSDTKAERKMETSEPQNIASALYEYVKYSEKSEYLNRLSVKEIKKLNADSLLSIFKDACNYEMSAHFSGNTKPEIIDELLSKSMGLRGKKFEKSEGYISQKVNTYQEPQIFFVNKRKALQSKVFLLVNDEKYSKEEAYLADAFNLYFGGGFSGLVLQEIREYRSMAYTAAAKYVTPKKKGGDTYLSGFVGTQADKTLDALKVFTGLINDMPAKKERIKMIRDYLTLSGLSARPGFRELSEYIEESYREGYKTDPVKEKMPKYKDLKFEDIMSFYKSHIQGKPITLAIVGSKKRIDMKELKKYGKIVKVKEKKLFK